MVTVHFKLTDAEPVTLSISAPVELHSILEMCRAELNEEFGSVMVFRNSKIITDDDLVSPSDTLEVFPAISGG